MKNFIEHKLNHRQKINSEFKKLVREIRPLFLDLKNKIDGEESKKKSFDSIKEKYFSPLEELHERIMKETDRIATHFDSDEHLAHKDFLRDQMGPLFWDAPLHARSLLKPLGYAGDFEMILMLYDSDPFKGKNAWFKMINALGCRCISGRATAGRIPYLLNKFDILAKKKKSGLNILDLACGPSMEITEWMKTDTASQLAKIYLVDQDPKAIEFSKNAIESLKQKSGNKLKVHYYPLPIMDLLTQGIPADWPKFDFIYSTGLFDYLDDNIFQMALAGLFPMLAEGGELLIGNISTEDYSKTAKWYINDWPLIYRTKEDLTQLGKTIAEDVNISIESEDTGINLFLSVKK